MGWRLLDLSDFDTHRWSVVRDSDDVVDSEWSNRDDATARLDELTAAADDPELTAIAEELAMTVTTGDLRIAPGGNGSGGSGGASGGAAVTTDIAVGGTATVVDDDGEELGGKPSKGTAKDKRLKKNRMDGDVDPEDEGGDVEVLDGEAAELAEGEPPSTLRPWAGCIAMEGQETGDGREFAPDSLEWDLTNVVPLQWQREHLPEHQASVTVGRIDMIERRPGGVIWGEGVIDTGTDYGAELAQQMENEMAGGVSVDVDSVKDSDVELVFPPEEDADVDDDGFIFLFGPPPDKIVFHRGRIRAATLVAIPAFIEATIALTDIEPADDAMVAGALVGRDSTNYGAIRSHETATSEASWDGAANERRLPTPMPVETADAAYAWMAAGAVEDGEVRKTDLRFIHHEVSDSGTPGAANLAACSSAIGVLNGGRGGTTIPVADRQGVYNHLARHLRDAGREPPALMGTQALLASGQNGVAVGIDAPPAAWFADPAFNGPTGMQLDDNGRIRSHLCLWGTCHTSFQDRCVTPPREDDDYPFFHLGEIECRDGSYQPIGHITLGTGHAPTSLDAAPAAAHYDHTGHVAADIRVGIDRFGIWVAGAMREGLSERSIRALRGAKLSGDWRRIGGKLRLVAVLAVNVPGFPVPRTAARLAHDDVFSMVAAGVLTDERVALVEKVKDTHPGTLRVARPAPKE